MAVALAAAMMGSSAFAPGGNTVRVVSAEQAANPTGALNKLAGLSVGSLAGILSGGGLRYGHINPTYRNRFPVSVAQGKRNARKARNRLRMRGQHRKAAR